VGRRGDACGGCRLVVGAICVARPAATCRLNTTTSDVPAIDNRLLRQGQLRALRPLRRALDNLARKVKGGDDGTAGCSLA
jgi:hypothetical protein